MRALHSLDGGRVIESDSAFTSGANGGGLFDGSGALVGLLTFRSRGDPGSYYSVPVRWIRDRLPSDDQWADVLPLHAATPFWQRHAGSQPHFMRAAQLHAERRSIELIELTVHRQEDAAGAFTDVLRLAPDDASAWYGLALAHAGTGNVAESPHAQSVVAGFDRDLAVRLHDAIDRFGVLH